MAGRWHPTRVFAWLLAMACAAHAGEATEAASGTADQFKLMIGSLLMTDYIYRGIRLHKPSLASREASRHLLLLDIRRIFI